VIRGQPPCTAQRSSGTATLTLNRPEKRNALDVATFMALEAHLGHLESRTDDIGVVVLRGAGSCFSAGADISGPTRAPSTQLPSHCHRAVAKPNAGL